MQYPQPYLSATGTNLGIGVGASAGPPHDPMLSDYGRGHGHDDGHASRQFGRRSWRRRALLRKSLDYDSDYY